MRALKTHITFLLAAFFVAASFAYAPASAHRIKSALTTLVWAPNSLQAATRDGVLEITHRIHLHDAQVALRDLAGPTETIFELEGQARLLLYINQNFPLSIAGTEVSPEPLGGEVEGDFLYLYQELPFNALPSAITVHDTILMDIFPDQLNQVFIDVLEVNRTLDFNILSEPQTADLATN